MVISLQRAITSLVHAHAGRTQVKTLRRSQTAQVFEALYDYKELCQSKFLKLSYLKEKYSFFSNMLIHLSMSKLS